MKDLKASPSTSKKQENYASPNVYEPSDLEIAALERVLARNKGTAPSPQYKVERQPGDLAKVAADHPEPALADVLLRDTFGTGSGQFSSGLLDQMIKLSRSGHAIRPDEINSALAFIRGIGPRDETEALLASQMVAIHNATMTAARRLQNVETIPQQDSAANMLNRLARTFAAQIEALKRYRSSGEQTIKVQHVTVNSGGQAIVGDVTQGGGTNENTRQPHEPEAGEHGASAGSAPLLGHVETQPFALPGPGGERLERVPLPRRPRRRTQRSA